MAMIGGTVANVGLCSVESLLGPGVVGLLSSDGLQQQPTKPDAANLQGVLASLESAQHGH